MNIINYVAPWAGYSTIHAAIALVCFVGLFVYVQITGGSIDGFSRV